MSFSEEKILERSKISQKEPCEYCNDTSLPFSPSFNKRNSILGLTQIFPSLKTSQPMRESSAITQISNYIENAYPQAHLIHSPEFDTCKQFGSVVSVDRNRQKIRI